MSTRRITVGTSQWSLLDEDAAKVLADIESALRDGTVARLNLADENGRPVTVFVNGRTVKTVAIDLDSAPRPSEIS